jgi:hypothetical protein
MSCGPRLRSAPQHAEVLERLNGHLLQWLPTRTPLEFIISSYETMWRVEAVTVARAGHDCGARAAFPARTNIETVEDREWSISYVTYWTSIHRADDWRGQQHPLNTPAFKHGGSANEEVADLEALHRDKHTWEQQGIFDPI